MAKKSKRFGQDGFYGTTAWKTTREKMIRRDMFSDCPLCGRPLVTGQRFTVDHDPPRRKLPRHQWLNPNVLKTMHWDCHNRIKQSMEANDKPPVNAEGYPQGWE